MSISHAPAGSAESDISGISGQDAENSPLPDQNRDLGLTPIVPVSARHTRVPRWLRRTIGPVLLLALWQLLSSTGVLTPVAELEPVLLAGKSGIPELAQHAIG